MAAARYGLVRHNLQRLENGLLRPLPGATVAVYDTLASGAAPVSVAGAVDGGAVLSTIYTDRDGVTIKTNPLTSDAQGLIEFFTPMKEVHFLITPTVGTVFGVQYVPAYGSPDLGVIQSLASDPSNPIVGQLYFNSTSDLLKVWDGSAWKVVLLS